MKSKMLWIVILIMIVGAASATDFVPSRRLTDLIKGRLWRSETMLKKPYKTDRLPPAASAENQFLGYLGHFVLVGDINVPVFASPTANGEIVAKLQYTQRVRVVDIQRKKDGKTRKWAFVVDEAGQKALGWVQNHHLVYRFQFKAADSWDYQGFALIKGDYFAKYKTDDKGVFVSEFTASGGGIHLKGKRQGRMFRYRDLVWAKKKREKSWVEFFYFKADGTLQPEWKFRNQPLKIIQ
ncbi:MAG: hypothetical protein ACI9BD_001506 [Candidatus Marinamargulisbacteria bacterium]|jgi:hypothetical protein